MRIIIPSLLTLLAGHANAADIYVSLTGDDKAAGSKDAPLKTIQAGINLAKPGDTVLVTRGIYRERFVGKKLGSEGNRITIKASPRRSVIMEGFEMTGGYVTLEGFQITHAFSGLVTTAINCTGESFDILDNYIYDVKKLGIWISGKMNHVAKNKIYKPCQGMGTDGVGYVIENNEIARIYNYGYQDGDYFRFFGDDGVIRNNFLHGNFVSERAGHPDGFQTFDDNGEHAHNIIIEGNLVGDTVAACMIQAWYGKKSDGGLIIRNNVFYNLQQGISGGTVPNTTVENNVFYNIKDRCGESGPGSTWKNNIYVNCRSTVSSDYSLFSNVPGKKAGTGCVTDADPMFVDPDKLDFHLKPGSPAIDAGDPNTPVPPGGGSRVDIGAYEYTAAATK